MRKALRSKLSDDAMHQIWREWFEFYTNHFRAGGIAMSAADQMAFYEIAQPVLRGLMEARSR